MSANGQKEVDLEQKVKIPRHREFRAVRPEGRAAKKLLFGRSWFDEFRTASLLGEDARKFLDVDQKGRGIKFRTVRTLVAP